MNRKEFYIIIFLLVILTSCSNGIKEGMILFTQVPAEFPVNDSTGLYQGPSRIVAMDMEKPEGSFRVITGDFYAARAPEISFEGTSMIFVARKSKNDHWQIWEMDLKKMNFRQITDLPLDCSDPVWLPGEKLAFSHSSGMKDLFSNSLYSCKSDGSDFKQITFDPYGYFTPAVLKDGRIVSVRRKSNYAEKEIVMVLRPDGTKNQVFYTAPEGNKVHCRMKEANDGKLVFVETDVHGSADIISIRYNRPLHSRENITGGSGFIFHDVFPGLSGRWLVSYKEPGKKQFSIAEFDPEKREIGKVIFDNSEFNSVEVVIVEKIDRPKKLPSEVDPGVKTGLLLCQDINHKTSGDFHLMSAAGRADRIEVIGIDSILGLVKVEDDGSFYLKVIADIPFRIRTLDIDGNVIDGPCDWIYLRPNERRGCIGCHEDPEEVPENRLPLSVKKAPVNIPVQIKIIKEKEILLE
jgi:hypothetical protein